MEHAGFRITLLIVLILITGGLIGNAVRYSLISGHGGCGIEMSADESLFMMWLNIFMALAGAILIAFVIYKMYLEDNESENQINAPSEIQNLVQFPPMMSGTNVSSNRSNAAFNG